MKIRPTRRRNRRALFSKTFSNNRLAFPRPRRLVLEPLEERTLLNGQTPAMALGLTDRLWSVLAYIQYPVHVSDLQREDWAEQRENVLTSVLDRYKPKKSLPTS